MELNLDTGKLVVFLAGLGCFFMLETLWPARRTAGPRWRRLLFHGGIAAFNTTLIRVVAYVPALLWAVHVEEQGWGISRWLGLVGWAEILLSIVVLDFFDYLWHRANHRVRFLWRFHKAHHADTAMDITTALRFHPGELLISVLVKAGWVVIWGPTVVAWFLFEALVSLSAQFHHTNIDFPNRTERWLSRLIVTPRFHAAHHLVDQGYGNRNFSTILSVWDRLFGSRVDGPSGAALGGAAGPLRLGLPHERALAFSFGAWLAEPLRQRNLNVPRSPPDH
jgi:sterol desaturase/sphingolipid hydroxylase (fatty acid hydroxylase superfamily)